MVFGIDGRALFMSPAPTLKIQQKYGPWFMLAPCLLTLTLVGIYSLFYSIYISLTAYQPTNPFGEQGCEN